MKPTDHSNFGGMIETASQLLALVEQNFESHSSVLSD